MKKYDIYLIWGKDCDGNILRYYGSTANLIKRKSEHIKNYNKWVKAGRPSNNTKCSSVYILDNGDWKIEKLDEVIGERWEAIKLESEYQKNNECVNICIASRTPKEYYKDNRNELNKKHKQYYETHKDIVLEKQKEYYNLNKQVILEKHKQYYETHKDELIKKQKELYNLNKQAILEKQKEKIICECGAKVAKRHLARHRKSKKHINFINSN